MINHIVDVKVKPGRATDFCRAIQNNLSIWRAQVGFVDEIVLSDPMADHVVAQSFWSTEEDADRFNAEVFPRITAIVKDLMAAPPVSTTYKVAVSTNRNIVPEGDMAESVATPSARKPQSSRAVEAIKLPPAIIVSGLELLLELTRGARNLYDSTIDEVFDAKGYTRRERSVPKPNPAIDSGESDVVRDTLNAVIAFVAPGPDVYSVAQGESTPEPGGCDAGIVDDLIRAVNATQPEGAEGTASLVLVAVLNQTASQVKPNAQGPFGSPFACLSMSEKAAVFQVIENNAKTQALAGVLVIAAFLVYSEAGVFDSRTRTITARPLGWALSNYEGVSDGRGEFKGYFQGRQCADAKLSAPGS